MKVLSEFDKCILLHNLTVSGLYVKSLETLNLAVPQALNYNLGEIEQIFSAKNLKLTDFL